MLPSAQQYLNEGGLSSSAAAWVTIGCFLAGVVGIQILSRLLHHYIPSHVVDCEDVHEDTEDDTADVDSDETIHEDAHKQHSNGKLTENTPLISRNEPHLKANRVVQTRPAAVEGSQMLDAPYKSAPPSRRPSLHNRLTTRMSTFVAGSKVSCDGGGPCYGYTDLCGRQCHKTISRSPTRAFGPASIAARPYQPSLLRAATSFRGRPKVARSVTCDEESLTGFPSASFHDPSIPDHVGMIDESPSYGYKHSHKRSLSRRDRHISRQSSVRKGDRPASVTSKGNSHMEESQHHHHVAENAFLSIGLQTSIAIALHKLPEGFITYATNHANPQLGFSVFMALFIHNITEGFAMALPLYLAINSRARAMFWSSLLGGVSQPLGAGVAALWFKVAGRGDMAPGDTVYGCMFSITAGIMASVALQLFSESLTLTHNPNVCTFFAFIGMGVMGASHALTARS